MGEMFDEIWTRYSEHDLMTMHQLNALLHDTDQESGEQVVDEAWWHMLCKDKGADPSQGLSKFDLLSFYFEDPGSSIKRDFFRIFFEGDIPSPQMEEKQMFNEIWTMYSEQELMDFQQFNALFHG